MYSSIYLFDNLILITKCFTLHVLEGPGHPYQKMPQIKQTSDSLHILWTYTFGSDNNKLYSINRKALLSFDNIFLGWTFINFFNCGPLRTQVVRKD